MRREMFCEGKREKTDQPGHISTLAKRAGVSGSERIASFSKLKLAINGIITALRIFFHESKARMEELAKRAGVSESERSFSKLKLAITGIITALRLLYQIFISQQEKPTLQLLRSSSAFF